VYCTLHCTFTVYFLSLVLTKISDSDVLASVRGQRKMIQVLGAFGLLDFTMLRPILAWGEFWNLWAVYFFNSPIFRAAVNRGYWISGYGGTESVGWFPAEAIWLPPHCVKPGSRDHQASYLAHTGDCFCKASSYHHQHQVSKLKLHI
jgi:hypothetical protein